MQRRPQQSFDLKGPGNAGLRRRVVRLALAVAVAAGASGCAFLPVLQSSPPGDMVPQAAPYVPAPPPSEEALARLSPEERALVEIYQRLNPAVVNITSVSVRYNWFLRAVPQEGTGSGSIFDPVGYVLTNHHVVKGAQRLFVTLYDGSSYAAEVVGADAENDLAVIRFDPGGKELETIAFGSSADVVVGQTAIALGNPFGLERTLTTGVISGLRRPLQTQEGFIMRELMQTDAAINPGNSGGPLLDSRGQMIGVNTMILSPAGGNIGIGFAVPVDIVKRVIPDLLEYGTVQRGWLDIMPIPLYQSLAVAARLPTSSGILVSEVAAGSTAARAGIQGGGRDTYVRIGGTTVYLGGDIIVAIEGKPVTTISDYLEALESTRPGDVVILDIIRGTQRRSLEVELAPRPASISW